MRQNVLSVYSRILNYNLPFTIENIEDTIANGHLHVLVWAYERGLELTAKLTYIAAEHGQINILKWLRENGCPWDGWTCAFAAEGGHLNVLI